MFDPSLLAIITGWTIALVAGLRKSVPAIDGPWVLLVSAGAALLAASIQFAPHWVDMARYAAVAWIGAVGGMTAVQRLVDRAAWPEASTARQSPQAKR